MSRHSNPHNGFSQVSESGLWLSDNTIANVSTTRHGLAPKAPNDATQYLDGTGSWSVPAGSGTGSSGPGDHALFLLGVSY